MNKHWYTEDMAAVMTKHPAAMCIRKEFGSTATGLRRDTCVIAADGVELHRGDVAESEGMAWKLARIAMDNRRAARVKSRRWWFGSAAATIVIAVLGMDIDGDGHNSLWDITHARPFLTMTKGAGGIVGRAEVKTREQPVITCWRSIEVDGSFGPTKCWKHVAGLSRF